MALYHAVNGIPVEVKKVVRNGESSADVNYVVKDGKLVWAKPNMYLTGPVNYEVVGSPTITDGVASGFTSSNSIKIAYNPTAFFDNSYEFVVMCLYNSNPSGDEPYALSWRVNGMHLGIGAGVGVLRFGFGNVGGSKLEIASNIAPTLNMWYWLKGVIQNKVASFYYSTDGENYALVGTNDFSDKTPIETIDNGRLCIGSYGDGYGVMPGSVDLNATYIKVNDQLWFYGKNYATQNIAPVPAGYTFGTTTTPSIGYVDMRTQQFTAAPSGATIGRDE